MLKIEKSKKIIKTINKMIVNLWKKMNNQIFQSNPTQKVLKKVPKVWKVKATIHKKKKNFLQAENVSINFALQKKFIKRFVQEYNKISIVFSARIVMKITTITFIANFVNKFIQIVAKMKMMINGLAAIIAKDGYNLLY